MTITDMQQERIAIIGSAYRLPGDLDNDEMLWKALIDGKDLVTKVPEYSFSKAKFYHQNKNRKGKSYTFRAGVLSDYSSFDHAFFNISAKEAAQMDPQQFILLETTWRALENAGCDPASYRGSNCGVYVGVSSLDFAVSGGADASSSDMYSSTGSVVSIAANRISYFFDLKGPSMAIDTACSSSLVALHQACLSLKSGEIDSAIVCGVNYIRNPNFFITQSKAQMLSPEGKCKSFSNEADGYVRSEGCIVIVLKKLSNALAGNDFISGLILNTSVNSDGQTNGLPMPGEDAQFKLLLNTYRDIGINHDDLSYIEAHGTGTRIGDPIEVSAISRAIASKRQKPLPIGSIKSNIG
ncbi:MAG: polyketide synthase, partial [Candidatus Methanoperedens sp.]